jgi:hypothetical protein
MKNKTPNSRIREKNETPNSRIREKNETSNSWIREKKRNSQFTNTWKRKLPLYLRACLPSRKQVLPYILKLRRRYVNSPRTYNIPRHYFDTRCVVCVFCALQHMPWSPHSCQYSDGLDGSGSIPGSARFSLLRSIQIDFGTHTVSYQMGTGGSFHGGKAAGAWS